MAVTTVSDLDSIIQVIVAETQFTSRQGVVMRQLVRVLEMPEHKGNPIDRPKLGKLTANNLTEGADIAAPQSLTDTDISINPTEVGLQSVLTDRMLSRAPMGFDKMVAEEHARAYKEKMDTDLLGLFSGFSTGESSAGNAINLGDLGVGRARVKGASEPGPEPFYYVLHTYHAWDIQGSILPLSSGNAGNPLDGVSQEVVRSGLLGQLFGTPVFESGLISVDSSDDAYSAIFSKEAILLVVTDEGSMRPERDESLRATELNYVGEYGFGEWVDSYGFYFLNDATAPTAG